VKSTMMTAAVCALVAALSAQATAQDAKKPETANKQQSDKSNQNERAQGAQANPVAEVRSRSNEIGRAGRLGGDHHRRCGRHWMLG
jgi:uncharacterized protein YlxW (UPF0749 family)